MKKNIYTIVSLLAPVTTVGAFQLPLLSGSIEVKRHSVIDLPGYKKYSCAPEGISFVKYGHTDITKPTAVFIPGLEFSCLSLSQYADFMKKDFNLVYTCMDNINTQPMETIVNAIDQHIQSHNIQNVTIIGESSGAILTLALGLKNNPNIQNAVLINPATAYPKSYMEKGINLCRHVREWEYRIAVLSFLSKQKVDIEPIVQDEKKMYLMTAMLLNILFFPKNVLLKRIDEWIIKGIKHVNNYLDIYPIPVLLVASKNDEMFSSITEAERLHQLLPESNIVHVPFCGHLTTPDKLPLADVIFRYLKRRCGSCNHCRKH